MDDRRLVSKWHKEIFLHCVRNKKPKRPTRERRGAMDSKDCPKCGIKIYGRAGSFKCPICGDFKVNCATGELEKVEEKEE